MTSSPLANLADQTAELLATIAGLATIDQLREAEPSITGKRSILSALQKSFGVLAPEDRKEAGAQLQEARRVVEAALEARRRELSQLARAQILLDDGLDLGDVVVADVRWPASVGHPSLIAITQRADSGTRSTSISASRRPWSCARTPRRRRSI